MAAAYASLVSLMRLIHDIEHHPSPPISLNKQLLHSVAQHITFFQEFLHAYNNRPPPVPDHEEEVADPLEMCIAAAAYAAEDAIESHIVDTIQQHTSNYDDASKITRLLNSFRAPKEPNNENEENIISITLCHVLLQSVLDEMDSIKKVAEKNKVLVVHDQVAMTNIPASVARNETMAGSDDVLLEIMEKLTGGRLDRQVIPIEGMGGIGKTYLATSVCALPLIKEHFDICVWATISQHYNAGEILCELLSQATKINKEQLSGKSEDVMGLELYKYLSGRRYLIVMHDMWSIGVWDKIQLFFPNNKNGSRVLVTTRLSQLCSQLNNDDYSLRMSFLDESSSWSMFSKTVFGEKSCPPELKNIGEKIVDNCRGLPLSIAVVGDLLKNMDNTRASWESIRDNLSSVVNMDNDKHCLRLLKLSYNHLPVYLKPCFLYMGVFDEDDEIRVSTLVKLWISEGFLNPKNDEALETTGKGYLQDLVDRNLILIGRLGRTGSIKSCKIHDLVRDMCLKEGEKEVFYHVIGQCNPPSPSQRRVVISRNISMMKVCDHLRSMPYARSVISEDDEVPPYISNLGLLRTLHANNVNARYKFNFLRFGYVNLRYLAINGGVILSFERASLFWNLQTLIISCKYELEPVLVVDFWKMPQLRHFEFVDGHFLLLPEPPSHGLNGDSVVIMENLHTLMGVVNLKCSEGLINRIPNIKKLKLDYDSVLENDEYCLGNIKSLCGLESLTLLSEYGVYSISHVEYYNNLTFPHSLKKLTLDGDFEWEDDGMLEKIGLLSLLEKLRLLNGRFRKAKWETLEGQFPCLKYLDLFCCSGLENWTAAEEGSNILPRLEHLWLLRLTELKKIPCELGNIDTLKIIQLVSCGEGAVKCAKEMVDEQLESQGELNFHVEVEVIGENQQHLLSLAGTNFQVRQYGFHNKNV